METLFIFSHEQFQSLQQISITANHPVCTEYLKKKSTIIEIEKVTMKSCH